MQITKKSKFKICLIYATLGLFAVKILQKIIVLSPRTLHLFQKVRKPSTRQ